MSTTSVHLSPELVAELDRCAVRYGTSRNRVIVRACEAFLEQDLGSWPDGFFSDADLTPEELRELREGSLEVERAILEGRRSRPIPPL